MDFSREEHFTAKKASGIGVVVLVHALLAGALVYGLHTTFKPRDLTDINVHVDPSAPRQDEPQPTIDPQVKKVNVDITRIDHPIIDTAQPDPIPRAPHDPDADTKAKPTGPDVGPIGGGGEGNGGKAIVHSSNPVISNLEACKPPYPAAALKLEEEGTVRLKLEIGANNQLLSASVLKSSGYGDLDRAAMRGLSQCSFKAAVQDGTPIQSSLVTDYVWSLDR